MLIGKVSELWMKGKIILLNKDKGNIFYKERTRPITILANILKWFVLSILHNIEKIGYEDGILKKVRLGSLGGFRKNALYREGE